MSEASTSATPVHLLTCVHGMWGNPNHLGHLAKVMTETIQKTTKEGDAQFEMLIAETNREAHTYDGVDWGAERVVQEIKETIASIESDGSKKVTKFSIIGYSLGGLLARYVVGILNSQRFFDKVVPMNFATIATPNIGLLRYPSMFSTLAFNFGPILLSRTGQHFYAKDDWSDGKPLLEAMSEPGGVFYDGLAKFEHATFYANAINDNTVPFVTAASESFDPFVAYTENGIEIELDEKYSPIIKSYTLPQGPPPVSRKLPKKFSKKWWVQWWNKPSSLPPFLQRKWPYNIVVYAIVPILIPVFVTLILSNFTLNSLRSAKRIRLMEKEGKGSRSELATFVRSIERELEDVVVDFMDDGVEDADPIALSNVASGTATPTTKARRRNSIMYTPLSDPHSQHRDASDTTHTPGKQNQPILSDVQRRIIKNLNTLPNLEKRFVFLDGMRNSHATIVCRDVKNFEFHRRGEGVLRHLAEHFEV